MAVDSRFWNITAFIADKFRRVQIGEITILFSSQLVDSTLGKGGAGMYAGYLLEHDEKIKIDV